MFNVKSSHKLGTSYELGMMGVYSQFILADPLWRYVWNVNGATKTEAFYLESLHRWACKGSLAVDEDCFRMHLVYSLCCSRCLFKYEYLLHAIIDYSANTSIWKENILTIRLVESPLKVFCSFISMGL